MSSTIPIQSTGDTLLKPAKTLFIDDDEQWVTLVKDRLTQDTEDFDIVTAASLDVAKRHFLSDSYECVLCNYRLGDGTGLELLDTVRESNPELPFILVTVCGDEAITAKGIRQGISDHVRKELIREDISSGGKSVLATKLRCSIQAYRTHQTLQKLSLEEEVDTFHQVWQCLTNRQQTILLEAFHQGYFEHPSNTNPSAIADAIDIEKSVYRRELRTAQRRLLESIIPQKEAKQ